METDKMISVIIPVYNVEPYIERCLDSVMGQTYENLEIILIDDGSPDNCGKICDEYAQMDDRVTVVHKKNGGVGAARNTGIDMAQGKWIALVDPDDWLELDYYAKMMDGLDGRDVDVFSNGGYIALIIFTVIEAFVAQLIYKKSNTNKKAQEINLSVIVYSYVLYTIFMGFFSDRFFCSVFTITMLRRLLWWLLSFFFMKIRIVWK